MNTQNSTKVIPLFSADETVGAAVLDRTDDKNSLGGLLAMAILGLTLAFALPSNTASPFVLLGDSIKSTTDAIFDTFSACLLPGFNDSRSSAYAGHQMECRIR